MKREILTNLQINLSSYLCILNMKEFELYFEIVVIMKDERNRIELNLEIILNKTTSK